MKICEYNSKLLITKEKQNLVTNHTTTLPSKLSQEVNYTSTAAWNISGLNKYIQESKMSIKGKLYKSAWLQLQQKKKFCFAWLPY